METMLTGQVGPVRPSRSYDKGRVCSVDGCETKLSIYNSQRWCSTHSLGRPGTFRRVRGQVLHEIPSDQIKRAQAAAAELN